MNNHNYQVVNEMFGTKFLITKLIIFFDKLTPTFFNSQQIGLELIIALVPAIPIFVRKLFIWDCYFIFVVHGCDSRGITVSQRIRQKCKFGDKM